MQIHSSVALAFVTSNTSVGPISEGFVAFVGGLVWPTALLVPGWWSSWGPTAYEPQALDSVVQCRRWPQYCRVRSAHTMENDKILGWRRRNILMANSPSARAGLELFCIESRVEDALCEQTGREGGWQH